MSSPILVYSPENTPFDILGFARAEIPNEFTIQYIAEIPPDVDNPLDESEMLSELFSHPRKPGWGLFVSYTRRAHSEPWHDDGPMVPASMRNGPHDF